MQSFDIHNYNINSCEDLAKDAAAVLKKREGRTIKSGGLWVYDNEIAQMRGDFEDGDIISVEDFDGYFMGYGFINRRSKITVRLLSRRRENKVTPAFLAQRVRSAWEYRKKVIDTSSCRLIFGEADFLPGLTVDKYEDILVVESLALGIDRLKGMILAALVSVLAEDGIKVRGIYERSDAKVRELEGMPREKGFLTAPFDTKIETSWMWRTARRPASSWTRRTTGARSTASAAAPGCWTASPTRAPSPSMPPSPERPQSSPLTPLTWPWSRRGKTRGSTASRTASPSCAATSSLFCPS